MNANDLSKSPPRSPRVRISGFPLLARAIDKGRATLAGTAGGYHFDCPLDNMLFGFKEVNGTDVRRVLESGASDDEVAAWLHQNGTPKSEEEIAAWAASLEAYRPFEDPQKKEWFSSECRALGLDPVTTTLFDYLEADDRA